MDRPAGGGGRRQPRRVQTEPATKGGLLTRCFAEGSDSEDSPGSEEAHGTDEEDEQPNLSRLRTFDPFNQPEELTTLQQEMAAGGLLGGTGPAPQAEGQQQLPTYATGQLPPGHTVMAPAPGVPYTIPQALHQVAQPQVPQQMLPQQHPQHQQQPQQQQQQQQQHLPMGMVGAPSAPGGMMLMATAMPPGTTIQGGGGMSVQMVPAGMQAMLPPGALQMQPGGGGMQMMGVAMPGGMGTMMLVPGNYVGAGGNYVSAPGMPQVVTTALQTGPAGALEVPRGMELRGGSPRGSPSGRPQPQTVTCALEADGVYRVRWTVDARKLKGNDKTVVSPPFEIPAKAAGTFKMMINPTPSKLKGGATFRNSGGKGSVQLKCDTASDSRLRISFSIGEHNEEPPRGPLEHNFALNGVCGLPREHAEWDFNRVVDENAKTFVVCLELF